MVIISLFIFGILFLVYKFVKIKSNYTAIKWTSFGLLLIGFLILFLSVIVHEVEMNSNYESSTADGFTIEKFDIDMNVNESNSIDIKEKITVNFYEENHHGIYRFIPSWLKYTNKDGVTESRQSKISNLKAVGENYTTDTVNGKTRIKIGDPYYTLPTGEHTYEINYTYNMGSDPYDNFDEFIFHAFGDFWGTPIINATITVHMPKDFDESKIKFFSDKQREEDITSFVIYEVKDNTIYAKVNPDYSLSKSLTVDIELPENYFTNNVNTYGYTSLTLCLICIIFAIITFVLWLKNGKNYSKVPETVEFYPPEGLDAADIGYLNKKDTGKKLTIALIVELASKGFIKITESEDKKTQTISKINTTDINKYINREIKVNKLKDFDSKDRKKSEEKKLNEYFPEGKTEYIITSNYDNFYKESKYLVDNGYIKIESDTINNYTDKQIEKMKKELTDNEFKDKPEMTKNEKAVYDKLFTKGDETVLSENTTFYKVFNIISENVKKSYESKIHDIKSYKNILITSLGFLMCSINWLIAYGLEEDLNPKFKIIYTLALISNIIIFFLSLIMTRKSQYGEQMKSKINGFKRYIELAEKNQINMLVEQNPNYFYDILPYAYVLGVSKKWIEKFEKIPEPKYDMGNFNFTDISAIDILSDSVYYPSYSVGSSGCSSCGGGCSSCGGGCSSCGGGGSW